MELQDFDIQIKPLNEVKGQGLCKLISITEALNIPPPLQENDDPPIERT